MIPYTGAVRYVSALHVHSLGTSVTAVQTDAEINRVNLGFFFSVIGVSTSKPRRSTSLPNVSLLGFDSPRSHFDTACGDIPSFSASAAWETPLLARSRAMLCFSKSFTFKYTLLKRYRRCGFSAPPLDLRTESLFRFYPILPRRRKRPNE